MPCFDRKCKVCGHILADVIEPSEPPKVDCACGGETERVWLQKANAVIGDEIDVYIKNGLCHADGSPRRFTSREELRRAEKKAGLTNYVVHTTGPGTDKSRHTRKWD